MRLYHLLTHLELSIAVFVLVVTPQPAPIGGVGQPDLFRETLERGPCQPVGFLGRSGGHWSPSSSSSTALFVCHQAPSTSCCVGAASGSGSCTRPQEVQTPLSCSGSSCGSPHSRQSGRG